MSGKTLSNERLLQIVKQAENKRCSCIVNEYSCDENEDCKACRMGALGITEEEHAIIFKDY